MHTLRTPAARRPSRLSAGFFAVGVGLTAVLVVVGCYAFARVLADGLGIVVPTLIVRVVSALLGTAAAALAAALAFRLADGPVPPTKEIQPPPPPAEKTFAGPHDLANGRLNEHRAESSRGKEELPWSP
jgi:hypothetical protein